ncbi:MAG: hypothetical protein Q4C70_04095 [Planctomycetia bacterium]|nr:hypothetical protein [Planctomycetia bacterium]
MNPPRLCRRTKVEITYEMRPFWTFRGCAILIAMTVGFLFWTLFVLSILWDRPSGTSVHCIDILFVISDFFLLSRLLYELFFYGKLTLNHDGLTYVQRGFIRKNSFIPRKNLKEFNIISPTWSGRYSEYICADLRDGGKLLLVATMRTNDTTKVWQLKEMNAFIGTTSHSEWFLVGDDDYDKEEHTEIKETYSADGENKHVRKPKKCEWTQVSDSLPFEVTQKGRWDASLSKTVILGIFGGVWSCCTSVVILQLLRILDVKNLAWWGILLFILPFEFVGVFLLYCFFCELFKYTERRTLIFQPNQVTYRVAWLGVRRTKTFHLEDVTTYTIEGPHKDAECMITFRNAQDKTLGKIPRLTHSDARWLLSKYRQCVR